MCVIKSLIYFRVYFGPEASSGPLEPLLSSAPLASSGPLASAPLSAGAGCSFVSGSSSPVSAGLILFPSQSIPFLFFAQRRGSARYSYPCVSPVCLTLRFYNLIVILSCFLLWLLLDSRQNAVLARRQDTRRQHSVLWDDDHGPGWEQQPRLSGDRKGLGSKAHSCHMEVTEPEMRDATMLVCVLVWSTGRPNYGSIAIYFSQGRQLQPCTA